MSYSNPKPVNPVSKFISWKGDQGHFQYYEKHEEGGENIVIDMPFYFVVLDELNTITGYSDEYQTGIFSNEIKNIKSEKIIIRSFKKGIHVEGLYSDIKDSVPGLRFAKSVYAMLIKDKEDFELVNFKLSGSAFSAWLDKKFNVEQFAVGAIERSEEKKKGATKYFEPVFKRFNRPSGLIHETAIKMDKELQRYFKVYKDFIDQQKYENEVTKSEPVEEEEYPMEKAMHQLYGEPEQQEEENDDLPF